MFQFVQNLYTRLDSGETPVSIFRDLTKAFNNINHQILIKKLEIYGIRGVVLYWIRSYLTDRKQIVELNLIEAMNRATIRSDESIIVKGVQQVSLLGPLLFLIYISVYKNDPYFPWSSHHVRIA